MMRRLALVVVALFVVMISYTPASAADGLPNMPPTSLVSFGAEFATGGEGSGSSIQSIYVPLIFTWFLAEQFDAGIELPYLSQRGSNSTVHLYQNTQNTTSNMTGRRGDAGSSTTTGLGDIILRFGVTGRFETERLPLLRSSLYVKIPTASRSEGLGTGEFDAGVGMNAEKWYGDLQLTGETLYNYQGKATDLGLIDYFSYTVGIGWQVSNTLRPMLLVKGATPPSHASGDLREARIRLLWALAPATTLDLFYSQGIATSSPEYGGGIAVVYSY